jgi:vacuolar protein sorting-associated protein 13A/C
MFEQTLAYILKQFLGEFVEDSSKLQEKIHIGIWAGFVVLENLVLKKEILSVLNTPIALSHGVIGRFELRIPWKNLGSEPVVVIIDGLHILLEPKYEWDPSARDDHEQAIKQAKLAAVELFTSKMMPGNPLQGYRDFATKFFMDSILTKLVDNIQVTVTDVHIRYEDHVSCPSNFCVGVSFESLEAQSREKFLSGDNSSEHEESKASVDGGGTSFHKFVQLNQLSVYWNPITHSGIDACTSTFTGRGSLEIETLMSRTVAKRNHRFMDRPHHHYILLPVDIGCDLAVVIDAAAKEFKGTVQLNIAEIAINFEDNQFREMVSLATNMTNFAKLEEFSSYRPKETVDVNPRAWWR